LHNSAAAEVNHGQPNELVEGPPVAVHNKNRGLLNVQALRALAAVMVIVVHLEAIVKGMGGSKADSALFSVGVDLFFMISGFIMVYTTSARKIGPLAFLLNRIARIAPFYWAITLFVALASLAIPSLTPHTVVTGSNLVKSFLFIPYVRYDGLIRPILFLGWSLNLEMIFYLVFALSLLISDVALRVACCVSLLVIAVSIGVIFHDGISPEVQFVLQPLLLEFAIGMVIGAAYKYLPRSPIAGKLSLFFIPLSFSMLLLVARFFTSTYVPLVSLPAAILLISCLIADRSGYTIRSPTILLIGDASYAVYLVHPFVTQGVVRVSEKFAPSGIVMMSVLLIASMIAAILFGLAAYFAVEKPLSTTVRGWIAPPRMQEKKAAS
jgi:exopolysaccharide production protein ExoZ